MEYKYYILSLTIEDVETFSMRKDLEFETLETLTTFITLLKRYLGELIDREEFSQLTKEFNFDLENIVILDYNPKIICVEEKYSYIDFE